MSYVFKKDLVSYSKYNIKCPYNIKADFIVVHNTYNDAPAINEVNYMKNNNNEVSFHVAIDDKEVIQVVDFNRNTWACGDGTYSKGGNMKGISIEICYSKSGGERYNKAEENSVKYIAKLLYERNWGIDRVRSHKECTEVGLKLGYSKYVKNCPHRIYDEKRWSSFKKRIEKELEHLHNGVEIIKEDDIMNLLNATGRDECKKMIQKGVKEGLFSSKHENIEKYTDVELLSYALAYVNRKLK